MLPSLDVGAAALAFTQSDLDFAQYFGVNFYFRPIDPSEDLYSRNQPFDRWFGRSFSATLGITTNGGQIAANKGVTGIVGSQFLTLGVGLRVLEFVRLSGGTFFFRRETRNPLIDDAELFAGGYAGVSLDLAAFSVIASGYRSLTTGKAD